jgi:serine/threonine-protein kinase ATR
VSISSLSPRFVLICPTDSMRTHIVGILHSRNEQADWDRILAPFSIEASLIVGDWDAVEEALRIPNIEGPEVAFGKVIGAMREGTSEQLERAFFEARERLGSPIVAAGRESYRRVYDSVIHLHILHELEMIQTARLLAPGGIATSLSKTLTSRLESTSPSFRDREPILNMRRTAFRLM